MTAAVIDHRRPSADFLAELAAGAPTEGATAGSWPGLTFYRFTTPTELQRHRPGRGTPDPLTVGIVMHDRHRLVICDCPDRGCQIADASSHQPSLSLMLEVDPTLICEMSASMLGRDRPDIDSDGMGCVVAPLDDELTSSVLRFLRSLSEVSDREVLAPLYLRELVYRILQRDRTARLTRIAAQQVTVNPVAAALEYIADHLAEPLTVGELARQVNLSPSAFSRVFREVTGCSPYQFVKDKRLNRARELLEERRLGVTEVSRKVGYTSCSHFIKEFRARFGSTPGDYVSILRATLPGRA